MENTALKTLAEEIEERGEVSDPAAVTAVLGGDAPDYTSTDALLLVADRLFPGWSITIDGVASERDGHWVVVLRRSAARDNDPFLGIGKARALPAAVLAAILKAMAFLS